MARASSSLNGRVRRLERVVDVKRLSDAELETLAAGVSEKEVEEFLVSLGYPPDLNALTDEQVNSLIRECEEMIAADLGRQQPG